MSFIGRFVHRPVLVLMITLSILVVGAIAMTRLPLQLMPSGMSSDTVYIGVQARGLTPEEVQDEVYAPLEGELLTIPGVRNVTGRCRGGGLRASVELSPGLDPRLASAEVRDRLQRARTQWPAQSDRWWTWRESADSMPLMFFSLTLPKRDQATYDLINNEVVPKLEALDGVGQVTLFGMVDQTVRIFFDRQRLRAHRANLREILRKLQNDNISVPVGEIRDGETRFLVRCDLVYRDLETIRDLPIDDNLKLRDVATVERVRSYRDRVARVNGKYAFTGLIRKQSGANTVVAGRQVRALMTKFMADPRYAGLEPIYIFDQGEFIADSVNTLLRSALEGGVLAFIVLILFLRRLKMTLAITLSLPLSLLVAIGVMLFRASSFNILTMAALTISLGMLVDNSVVVLENIYRLRQQGLPWPRACTQGVQEVGLAVGLATLTSVVVFLPFMFASDNPAARAMLMSFGIPLCTALLASLFVALILLPAMTAFLHGEHEAPAQTRGDRGVLAMFSRYQERVIRWSLRHRFLAGIALLAVLGLGVFLVKQVETGVRGGGMRGQVSVSWEFPRGTTLAEADQVVSRYESWFEGRRDEYKLRNISARFDRRSANVNLSFASGTRLDWVRNVIRGVRKGLPEEPGIEPEVSSRIGGADDSDAKEGDRGFYIRLSGRDSEGLRAWGKKLGDALKSTGLAETVDLGRASAQDEVRMQVRRDRMQELSVDPRTLLGIVSAGLNGQQVSRMRQASGKDLRVIAEYGDSRDMELADLRELQIFSPKTGFNRLNDLAKFEFTKGYSSISRRNGVLINSVGGSRAQGVEMDRFTAGVAKIMRSMSIPHGYKWSIGGEARDQNEIIGALQQGMIVALLLVMVVMGILFESVVLPLAAGVTLIPAVLYGPVGLLIFGRLADTASWIGLLILIGVVVNNGIVLLDHIVRLRSAGIGRDEAILQGVRDRLRPILMTAATTIVGLAPMMFTDVQSQRGISYVGMSTVVASGLFFATFLTPVLVPWAYSILDDLQAWMRRVQALAASRTTPSERAALPPTSSV